MISGATGAIAVVIVALAVTHGVEYVFATVILAGKKLHLKHLSPDCRQLLRNAEKIIDVNIIEDPTYHLAVDKLA